VGEELIDFGIRIADFGFERIVGSPVKRDLRFATISNRGQGSGGTRERGRVKCKAWSEERREQMARGKSRE